MTDGTVMKVAGPLVVADNMSGTKMFEVVKVGPQKLVGEIIKLEADTASVQVYEDTSGLTVGDPITKTGKPLSLELGPGILNGIYDGIQRPLERIQQLSQSVFIPRGIEIPNLDRDALWDFTPLNVKVGDMVSGGDIVGKIWENGLFKANMVMVPPLIQGGKVKSAKGAGKYKITDTVVEIDVGGGKVEGVQLFQIWPVRNSRPVAEKLQGNAAMLTCERVIDALFPVTLGGTAAVPGAFGCGKTVISQAFPNTPTRTALSTWAVASVVTRCLRCSPTSLSSQP